MEKENIKTIVELVKAKVEILKLKADDYTWQCYVDNKTKEQLENTLKEIDIYLSELRQEQN